MVGVDRLDHLISLYRIKIRLRKWYHRMVFHFVDMVVFKCWLLYRRHSYMVSVTKKDQFSLVDFKYNLASTLCIRTAGIHVPSNRKRERQSLDSADLEQLNEEKRR